MTCETCDHLDAQGSWGPEMTGKSHCVGCHKTWHGIRLAHCDRCHEHFGGVRAFDLHRVGDACLKPREMRTKDMTRHRTTDGLVWSREAGF